MDHHIDVCKHVKMIFVVCRKGSLFILPCVGNYLVLFTILNYVVVSLCNVLLTVSLNDETYAQSSNTHHVLVGRRCREKRYSIYPFLVSIVNKS